MSDQHIREAQEQVISVIKADPAAALGTTTAKAVVGDGLACEVSDGQRSIIVDMPPSMGGQASGPTPGFHARAAVASCVAIGIKLTATRAGIALEQVEVDIEMDFDDGASLGLGSNTAAPMQTRLNIALKSDAPADELNAMVDRALEADPFFLALRDPQAVVTKIEKA